MKLVNAGLTSDIEVYDRLKNGDVFYTSDGRTRIYYDASYLAKGDTPFRFGNRPLMCTWSYFSHWLKEESEPEWKPCFCWVADSSSESKVIDIIITNENSGFRSITGCCWKYAIPLTREEAEKYINE